MACLVCNRLDCSSLPTLAGRSPRHDPLGDAMSLGDTFAPGDGLRIKAWPPQRPTGYAAAWCPGYRPCSDDSPHGYDDSPHGYGVTPEGALEALCADLSAHLKRYGPARAKETP